MKRKHHALVALVLMALSSGAVGLHAYQSLAKGDGVRPAFGREPLRSQSAPAPNIIREIEKLDMELSSLAHPASTDPPEVNLTLFGYEPTSKPEHKGQGGEMALPPEMNYSLSLAFSAGTRGFCVIDGVFCEQGSVLPDGAHIVRIEPHHVLIQKGEFLQWIPITDHLKSQHEKEQETGERA
jgi:hypothetical protein